MPYSTAGGSWWRASCVIAFAEMAGPGRYRQAPMAHRARLPGPETGDRPRPLRGSRMAGIPSPRSALDRGVRIPRRREESDSPLSRPPPSALRNSAYAQAKLPPTRTRRSGLSATLPIRSRRCERSSPSPLPIGCRDAHAACERPMAGEHVAYDIVRLYAGYETPEWPDEVAQWTLVGSSSGDSLGFYPCSETVSDTEATTIRSKRDQFPLSTFRVSRSRYAVPIFGKQ
jgi:hypothetical protein